MMRWPSEDTVTQLVAAIRRVDREVLGAEAVTALTSMVNYAQPGEPDIAWDDRAARRQLVDTLVRGRVGGAGHFDQHRHHLRAGPVG